ncbi:MAG TPA: 4-hydroxy-tetrahydrodipicolinate synthase [Pyrinomonadaceae bacterium]|nr:4-hydroxy-tetrahydrodipicolinate synthase [Pyrinomonadaceae bacterium]
MTHKIDWLRGCATALVTPFTSNGEIDDDALTRLIEYQLAGGVKLLVPCGTTGESATMTDEEDQRVIRRAIELAQGRAHIIAGTGSNSTAAAIENSKIAEAMGADALLVVAPYYNKPTQHGLYAHFRAVSEAVTTPIVIYNVPGRTSCNISAETTLRLARDCDNIVATKEASGNLAQIMEILRDRPADFRVLSGDDAMTFPMIALGADGLISVAANEAPELMSTMVSLALEGKWDEARELHYRLLPLMELNFIESSPGPVKAGLAMMNLIGENYRLPMVPVQEKSRAALRVALLELGLLQPSLAASPGTPA